MKRIYQYVLIVAAMTAMIVSCERAELENGRVDDGSLIGYSIGSGSIEAKSEQNVGQTKSLPGADQQNAITLTSSDGIYSLTLQRNAVPTATLYSYNDDNMGGDTKCAPVTGFTIDSRYNDGSLQVLALKDDGTPYIPQQKLNFMSRESGSSVTRWKTDIDYIWPSENLKFWSWAPYSASAGAGVISDASVSDGRMTFSYECPSSASEGKVAEAQNDVLVACSNTSPSSKGNVSLLYKHALSGIRFQVDRANKCTVKSVTLGNVYSKGDCSFDGSNITWSNQSEPQTFTENFGTAINEYLKDDYANPQDLDKSTDGTKTFLFIPQSATNAKKVTMTLVVRLDDAAEDITLSAELDPSDAIWEAGWTYTYSLCLGKSRIIYHWNDSGIPTHTKAHTGDAEIFEQTDYLNSGTYEITLHEPNWVPESTDDYYSFAGWARNSTATEAQYVQKGRSEKEGLPYQVSLHSENLNLYAVWKKVEYSGAWVDYENYIFNTQQGQGAKFDHIDDWLFNDHLTFTASMGNGYFEKINFPIHGLIPGKWYQMTFSEALSYSESSTDPGKDPNKMWNESSSYSTTIAAEPNLKSGKESGKLTYYPMIPQMYDYNPHHYVWAKHQSEVNGETYVPMSEQTITFYATSETMYWIWDMSKLYDKNYFKIRFSHSSIDMLPDVNEGTPYVDFPNTSYYGFRVKIDLDKVGDRKLLLELGSSTYKVSADYSNLVMYTLGSSAHEKINVPLKHLVSGKQYKLEFTHKREGYALSNEKTYDYCYAVKSGEVTSTESSNLHGNNGYSDNITDGTITSSVVFTADAETMYWVWSVSKLCSPANSATDKSMYNILSFYDVTLTQLD